MLGRGVVFGAVLALCAGACTTEEPAAPAPAAPAPRKSNPGAWKEIETPVPVGKKLSCAALLPLDPIGAAVARKLELVDQSSKDPDAAAVCRLNLTKPQPPGKAPPGPKGLVAGEELATVSVYCWSVFGVPDVKKRCTDNGEETSTDIGSLTCVRKVAAGDNTRFIITVLEPDTRCKLVVNPGPANTDLALTQATAKALVDVIDKDSLKAGLAK
jgi:hypothetical protein